MSLPIEVEIRAYRNPAQAFNIELYGFNRDHSHAATAIVMKEHVNGMRMDPFITLNMEEAQLLMDSLYDAGLRPSQSTVKLDVASMKNHLEDMRRIVFNKMDIPYASQP